MLLETTINLEQMGRAAKLASRQLATLPSQAKNQALLAIADEIEAQAGRIMAENALDMAEGRARGLSDALLDRLLLTPARVAALAADTRHVATLPDPVGADFESRLLPNGLRLSKRRIPIGVIGVTARSAGPVELGYWLAVDHWSKGFATEAARSLIDAVFTLFHMTKQHRRIRLATTLMPEFMDV